MVKNIFLLCLFLTSIQTQASFDERSLRYMSSHELLMTMNLLFPAGPGSDRGCIILNDINRSFLGDSNALTGEAVSTGPNQNLVQWVNACIHSSLIAPKVKSEPGFLFNKQVDENLLGLEVVAIINAHLKANPTESPLGFMSNLASAKPDVLEKMIAHQVKFFLGSDDVIKEFGLISNIDSYRAQLFKKLSSDPKLVLFDAMEKLSIHLFLRDEFLSY